MGAAEMIHFPPKGLVIPLVTPFVEQGEIDWVALKRLIERTLPYSSVLFIAEGWVGEGLSLPNSMRQELLARAVEIVDGRKPLFLSPTAETPEETLENMIRLEKKFSSGPGTESIFWVDLPLWYHSNRKLPNLYQEWARQTSFPILLYNHPSLIARLGRSLKRGNIRTAVMKRLSENEQIVGIIQEGDLKRTIHYQRAVRSRRDFRFYDGDEINFLDSPSSSGVVSAGANLLPKEWSEIVSASLTPPEDPGQNHLLLKQSRKLRELRQVLQAPSVKNLKVALAYLGVISHPRLFDQRESAPTGEDEKIKRFLEGIFSLQIDP
jgi:dihydrodipicolinate synthase/N-acetylneuraminate lyase